MTILYGIFHRFAFFESRMIALLMYYIIVKLEQRSSTCISDLNWSEQYLFRHHLLAR